MTRPSGGGGAGPGDETEGRSGVRRCRTLQTSKNVADLYSKHRERRVWGETKSDLLGKIAILNIDIAHYVPVF